MGPPLIIAATALVLNWKVGIDKGKYGPMGKDLFAEMCMRKNEVTTVGAFDISKDGCCEAKRPGNEKKNKKIDISKDGC